MAQNVIITKSARKKMVQARAGAITPVPGGVGTVTTSVLMAHVVEAAQRSLERA